MKPDVHRQFKQTLAKKHACYVLITCGEPNGEGHMDVEMTYEGDPALAAYLIHGAQSYIEENIESSPCCDKKHHFI